MAFQARITNVPDMNTFIDAFVAFAVVHAGFTNEGTTADGVRIVKYGDIYWCFYTGPNLTSNYTSAIPMYSRMTYTKPTTIAEVATVPGQASLTQFTPWRGGGPYISFYLFQSGQAIHAILEVLPNVFCHFSFGVINKNGVFEGGEYISTQSLMYNSYVGGTSVYRFYDYSERNAYPFDGGYGQYNTGYPSEPRARPGFMRHIQEGVKNTNYTDFAPIGASVSGGKRVVMVTITGQVDQMVRPFGLNSFNLRSPIMPIYVRSQDISNSGVFYHLGEVPGVGYLNGKTIPEAGLVDLDWQVFPIGARENPSDMTQYQTPTNRSLAYLRV